MSILFLTNSLLTTVQDLGRDGFRSFGVNQNGAMDKKAVRLTNILLGNDENEAVLEIHFPAPKILFEQNALIALGGADFSAQIDGKKIENWQTIAVKKGQVLSFPKKLRGNRVYLSVKGGFEIESWLNSRSTNLKAKIGGFKGRNLKKDDRINFKSQISNFKIKKPLKISPRFAISDSNSHKIRIIGGAEFHLLTGLSLENLVKNEFSITPNSDRMGFRLQGEPLYLLHEKEMVSAAVAFGTIQLLPDNQLIILMADHQTTGGYPRIGSVIREDLSRLAQFGAADKISFEIVSLEAAENLALEFERNLNFLKTAVKFYDFD